jgi:hypothetical protein
MVLARRITCCHSPWPSGHSHRQCEDCDAYDEWAAEQIDDLEDD